MSTIKITPIRVIPFDTGTDLEEKHVKQIEEKFEKTSSGGEFLLEDRVIKIEEIVNDTPIRIDVFKDGVGVISFVDKPLILEKIEDLDVTAILRHRAEVHKAILNHEHPFSKTISTVIKTLREVVQSGNLCSQRSYIRFTASDGWEKKGLSYVMSIYLIQMPELPLRLKDPTDKTLRRKITCLLIPAVYGLEDTLINGQLQFIKPLTPLDESFVDVLAHQMLKEDYDLYGSVSAFMSWANVVVAGNIEPKIIEDYRKLEIKLQHVWFYIYIIDHVVSDILDNFEEYVPKLSLKIIGKLRTRFMLKIDQFVTVQESAMGTRFFRLFEGLINSSKLLPLITRLENKLGLLKESMEREIASRRERITKRIELILFILACVGSLDGIFSVYFVVQDVLLTALICLPIIVIAFFVYLTLRKIRFKIA